MYENIGGKIKGLAKVIGCILAGITILIGIISMFGSGDLGAAFMILLGTALIAFLEIISTWAFYGFGQLIESAQNIENMMKSTAQSNTNSTATSASTSTSTYNPSARPASSAYDVKLDNTSWKCPKCGKINKNYITTCTCGESKHL